MNANRWEQISFCNRLSNYEINKPQIGKGK